MKIDTRAEKSLDGLKGFKGISGNRLKEWLWQNRSGFCGLHDHFVYSSLLHSCLLQQLELETPPSRFSFEQVNISSFIDRDLDENDLGGETLP